MRPARPVESVGRPMGGCEDAVMRSLSHARRALVASAVVVLVQSLLAPVKADAETLVSVKKVNFQPQGATVPSGYQPDHGQAFDAARGYGWTSMTSSSPLSLVGNGRERQIHDDQRLDTFVHMQLPTGSAGVATPGRWEHTLPSATYEVTVAVGDAGPYYDSAHSITVEGVLLIDRFVPSSADRFRTATTRVAVADGRLTLSPAGGTNTKVDYVAVSRVDATSSPLVVALQPNVIGRPVAADTQSLSYEVLDMTLPQFTTGNLGAYLRTLGPKGTLRIGGNSADQTFWTSRGEAAPSWATGTVTPAALSRLAGLLQTTGWKAVVTVNMKQFDPARAADEAWYARDLLGTSLVAIEIGNEPNDYYLSEDEFWPDYITYRNAILARVPGCPSSLPARRTLAARSIRRSSTTRRQADQRSSPSPATSTP